MGKCSLTECPFLLDQINTYDLKTVLLYNLICENFLMLPIRNALGIISKPDASGLDSSTYKIQFTLFLNFESHYHLRFALRFSRLASVTIFWFYEACI